MSAISVASGACQATPRGGKQMSAPRHGRHLVVASRGASPRLPYRGTVPHALEQLLPDPRIGGIGFGIGVPVEVAVERGNLERKWQKPVAELGVEDAGVAGGHRQD